MQLQHTTDEYLYLKNLHSCKEESTFQIVFFNDEQLLNVTAKNALRLKQAEMNYNKIRILHRL